MENEVRYLYLDDVIPNRFQPRENFDEQALKELAVSIKEHGVIQPIVVRQIGEKYEIIAGERRYKASTMAGLTKIPAIIKNLDDKESSKVALIENLQRKDLTAIEEARTYQKILELDALTQEELARTMGKSQSAVSNKLRLLSLTDEVQDALLHEQISERHARSLLNIEDKEKQVELLQKVIASRMTVRELDEEIKGLTNSIQTNSSVPSPQENLNIENPEINIPNINNNNTEFTPVGNDNLLGSNDFGMQNNLFTTHQDTQPQSNLFGEELTTNNNSNDELIGTNNLINELPSTQTSNINFEQPAANNIELENNLYQNYNAGFNQQTSNESINTTNNSIDQQVNNINNNLFDSIETNQNIIKTETNKSTSTVNQIKSSVEELRKNGNNIEMEEFDFEDFYQLVIRIDK